MELTKLKTEIEDEAERLKLECAEKVEAERKQLLSVEEERDKLEEIASEKKRIVIVLNITLFQLFFCRKF